MQNTRKTKYKMVAGALVGVAVLGVVAIATGSVTRAAENIDFNVHVNDSMGMEISGISQDGIKLTLDPANSAVQTGTARITVGSSSGYRLNVTADGTDLVMQGEDATDDVVPTLEAAVAEADFPANHWGYRVGNSGNFSPFEPGEINSSEGAVNADVTDFVFAAKADYETAPGTYALTLNFAITPYVNTITMQDLDPTLCVTGAPTVVTDSRDGQSYTVQRLADGKCWMTKNLNLAGGTKLDSDGSNVPSGYTQSSPYYTLPTSSTSGFSSDTTAYVYNSGRNTDSECSSSPGCYSYYSWLAATAGGKNASGSSVTSNGYNAAYSICPKGWRLPTSTTSNASAQTSPNWKTGDFYALATAYGANLASNYYDNSSATGANFYNNAGPGTSPGFLLAGYYYSSSFDLGGSYGLYWSSTSNSSSNAYNLNFNSSNVNSANNNNRRNGFSVRCLLAE